MTELQKLKENFKAQAKNQLGAPDRWGHYHFIGSNIKKYRIKIMKQVWRFEGHHTEGGGWFRIAGGKFHQTERLNTLLEIYKESA